MILPQSKVQFDKLAEEASGELFSNGVALNQSVVKIAQREKLNPEEVKRLVEKTNLHATLTMLKAASDKRAEIFLADPEEVLKETHFNKEEPPVVKVASTNFSIPNLRIASITKDVKLHPGIDKTATTDASKLSPKQSFTLTKKIEELSRKKVAEEIKVKDSLDFIISEFSKMRAPDFSKFAEEVYTIYGEPAVPVLHKISKITRDSFTEKLEKLATLVDDTTPLLKKYAEINSGLVNIIIIDSEITQNKKELSDFWGKVKCA